MFRFIIRRLLWTIPVLLVVLVVTFLLMHAVPFGPWDKDPERMAMKQLTMDESTREMLDRSFGLDKPMWRQFTMYVVGDWNEQGRFVCGLVCGNLGPSFSQRGRTVQEILFGAPEGRSFWQSRFGYSVRLALFALVFAIGSGIPLGVIAALKQNTWIDHLLTVLETLCISVPNFVIGLLLIVLVVISETKLITIAPRSWTGSETWVIPVVILGLSTMASAARLTRTSVLEVMRHDYIRTARAKGLSERAVIGEHILKNALIPVITLLGPSLAEMIAGSAVIEMMFGFPGMGSIYISSIKNLDYSMILGVTVMYATLVTLGNLFVDLAYGYLDPRVQVE